MKAVILAGGRGTRLAPYTFAFPKPLVPIGEHPILEIILRQLANQGFRDVTLTVGYLEPLIRAYFAQRPDLASRVNLSYVSEERATGTAGSLASVRGLDRTFLVMNGDILTNLNYGDLVKFHRAQGSALTIATHRKCVNVDLGVLETGQDGRVLNYREKPVLDYVVSMGIYVYEPHVLSHIGRSEYLDFPDLVLRLLKCGERVVAFPSEAIWLDIGRHEDYAMAAREFEEKRPLFGIDDPPTVSERGE